MLKPTKREQYIGRAHTRIEVEVSSLRRIYEENGAREVQRRRMLSIQVLRTFSEYRGYHEKSQRKNFMEVLRDWIQRCPGSKNNRV